MTDKERYEFAMRENHELREDLKEYKDVNAVLNNCLIKQNAVIEILQEKCKMLRKSYAKSLYRWATATRVAYASKGYGGIARRWIKAQEKFKRAWEGLK